MNEDIRYHMAPDSMEPLYPEDPSGDLENLAVDLIKKSSILSGALNPTTSTAIANFLRPMNSYYSNLIEGHDTHPIDIENALRKDYSQDRAKRDLQLEALAHIAVHEKIYHEIKGKDSDVIPSSIKYIKQIHKTFYDHLPESFKKVTSEEGKIKDVIPGELRKTEVKVGRHIAPYSDSLELFTHRFEEFYSSKNNAPLTERIIAIASSHHRLAWIHPFVDGNGRVIRLYSDACFMHEGLNSSGLWSISRGLARTNDLYKVKLANADLQRQGDYDGRGNLSNKMLIEFCKYFLETAIDQIEFMHKSINTENMIDRIKGFSDLMTAKNRLRPEAKFILVDVFLKGKISKADAMRITNTSDKTLKLTTDSLIDQGLLVSKKEGKSMMYYVSYPITFSPILFPGLYPTDKEVDMINKTALNG